jgi:hypothetical protein
VVSGEPVVELRGAAIRYCRTAIDAMVRTGRSDGIRPSPLITEVADVLSRGADQTVRTSVAGSAFLRSGADLRSSSRDEITAKEAAEMLHTGTRNVTDRCARGSLPGRLVAGRWMVERAAVCAAVSRKAS